MSTKLGKKKKKKKKTGTKEGTRILPLQVVRCWTSNGEGHTGLMDEEKGKEHGCQAEVPG